MVSALLKTMTMKSWKIPAHRRRYCRDPASVVAHRALKALRYVFYSCSYLYAHQSCSSEFIPAARTCTSYRSYSTLSGSFCTPVARFLLTHHGKQSSSRRQEHVQPRTKFPPADPRQRALTPQVGMQEASSKLQVSSEHMYNLLHLIAVIRVHHGGKNMYSIVPMPLPRLHGTRLPRSVVTTLLPRLHGTPLSRTTRRRCCHL